MLCTQTLLAYQNGENISCKTCSVLADCAKFHICPATYPSWRLFVTFFTHLKNNEIWMHFLTVLNSLQGRHCCLCNCCSVGTGPWLGSASRPGGKHNFCSIHSNFIFLRKLASFYFFISYSYVKRVTPARVHRLRCGRTCCVSIADSWLPLPREGTPFHFEGSEWN